MQITIVFASADERLFWLSLAVVAAAGSPDLTSCPSPQPIDPGATNCQHGGGETEG